MKFKSFLLSSAFSILGAAGSHAATITYEFTADSLDPTTVGLGSGVTANPFVIGSGFNLNDNGGLPDSIRFNGTDTEAGSATAFTNNRYVSFSVTIAAGTVVNLTSLSLKYDSTIASGSISSARVFSSIDGFDNIANDTIGSLGKGTASPQAGTSTISLSNPLGNSGVGSSVANTDFMGLTNTTVTFYLPWIDNETGNFFTDVDDITLTFDIVPEPSSMLLGAIGLLPLLRRKRNI